jgi:hypothetical protein
VWVEVGKRRRWEGGRRAAVIYPPGRREQPSWRAIERTINARDSHHSRYLEIAVKRKRWKFAEVVEKRKVGR